MRIGCFFVLVGRPATATALLFIVWAYRVCCGSRRVSSLFGTGVCTSSVALFVFFEKDAPSADDEKTCKPRNRFRIKYYASGKKVTFFGGSIRKALILGRSLAPLPQMGWPGFWSLM
ncbi:unnamed protein product [Ectocarpus sp. 12 AP-2014]